LDIDILRRNVPNRSAICRERVRVLSDDGGPIAGDEQIIALDAHPAIENRVFKPFAYRGHGALRRTRELLFNVENAVARMAAR
jgi:cardiolipin synthase C